MSASKNLTVDQQASISTAGVMEQSSLAPIQEEEHYLANIPLELLDHIIEQLLKDPDNQKLETLNKVWTVYNEYTTTGFCRFLTVSSTLKKFVYSYFPIDETGNKFVSYENCTGTELVKNAFELLLEHHIQSEGFIAFVEIDDYWESEF